MKSGSINQSDGLMLMNNVKKKLKDKFATSKPLIALGEGNAIAEIKPYLQPFEINLAIQELKKLVGSKRRLEIELPYATFDAKSVSKLHQKLAYWQRVGIVELVPTDQVVKEFSQNGQVALASKNDLHNARRLRYGVHNLHEYRGKFFPQLVKSLVNISGISGNAIVMDPMCGSGTTLVEAREDGYEAIGADLNPLSILISRVKCKILEKTVVDLQVLGQEIQSTAIEHKNSYFDGWNEKDADYLSKWFSNEALTDISSILVKINSYEEVLRDFLLVCLSNIIRTVSYQKESDLRVRKELKNYEKGKAVTLFKQQVEDQLDRIIAYKNVSTSPTCNTKIYPCNSIDIASNAVEYIGKVDLIITSPPYATALPYLDTDRLSLITLGLLKREEHKSYEANMIGTREITEKQRRELWASYLEQSSELPASINDVIQHVAKFNHLDNVGFRRKNLPALLSKYFLSMGRALKSAKAMMKKGGKAYYIVGNNSTILDGQKFEIQTPELLFDLAEHVGWKKVSISSMELLTSRDVFKANQGTSEKILELVNK